MFRLRLVVAAVLAVSALAVLAGPASAGVPAANAKFCRAAESITDTDTSGMPTKEQAKAAVKGFKNAAKAAPAKVKTALNNIAKYLDLVAGTTDPSDLAKVYTSDGFKNYAKSIQTYVAYYTNNCTG